MNVSFEVTITSDSEAITKLGRTFVLNSSLLGDSGQNVGAKPVYNPYPKQTLKIKDLDVK